MSFDANRQIDYHQCIVPQERSRYLLALFVVVPVTLMLVLGTAGVVLFVVPFFIFVSWLTMRITKAHFLGSMVEISYDTFPDIKRRLDGSFFAWLAESLSTHPHLTKRFTSLLSFAYTYDRELYEAFMEKEENRQGIEDELLATELKSHSRIEPYEESIARPRDAVTSG